MSIARLFTHDGAQAVRLPKGMQFEGVAEVEIVRQGKSLVLTPQPRPKASSAEPALPFGDALAAIWGETGLTDAEFIALEREIAASQKLDEPPAPGEAVHICRASSCV